TAPGLSALASAAAAKVSSFGAQSLANVAWGLARLAKSEEQALIVGLLRQSVLQVSGMRVAELCALSWSLAALGASSDNGNSHTNDNNNNNNNNSSNSNSNNNSSSNNNDNNNLVYGMSALTVLAARASLQVSEGKPAEICGLLWAFAKLSVAHRPLFEAAEVAAMARLSDFSAKALAGLAWAWATANLVASERIGLLPAIGSLLAERLLELAPQEIANSAWAFAVLKLADSGLPLLTALAEHRAEEDLLSDWAIRDLANVLWACATLSCGRGPVAQLSEAIACESVRKLEGSSPQDLANLAWAFAPLRIAEPSSAELVSVAAGRLSELTASGFANLSWAFATSATSWALPEATWCGVSLELSHRLVSLEAIAMAGNSSVSNNNNKTNIGLLDLAQAVVSTVWALNFADALDAPLAEAARAALLQDRLVVYKPPGWEVDSSVEVGTDGAHSLSKFVSSVCPPSFRALASDLVHGRGFVHRLDVPSSGLILVALTCEAYYDLRFQLSSGGVARDYVVLCHGWAAPELRKIFAPIDSREGQSSRILLHGKPSTTRVRVLGHASYAGCALSLILARICTGRKHQIRLHLAHLGHPTVCDGRYTSGATASSDKGWCQRNFLHRYRLAFRDLSGVAREVVTPLSPDLLVSLSLVAREGGYFLSVSTTVITTTWVFINSHLTTNNSDCSHKQQQTINKQVLRANNKQ
ncbi:unnamed protein product, partial [Polarella glacialis]